MRLRLRGAVSTRQEAGLAVSTWRPFGVILAATQLAVQLDADFLRWHKVIRSEGWGGDALDRVAA
jgi:hypothetical protein